MTETGAGMHLARNRADPGFKQRGAAGGPRLVAFTSEQAHYSYLKCATLTGLGSDNLVSVACDETGAMSPEGEGSHRTPSIIGLKPNLDFTKFC